jgi:hypothetical protein
LFRFLRSPNFAVENKSKDLFLSQTSFFISKNQIMSELIHLNVGEELVMYKRLSEPVAEPIATSGSFQVLLFCGILFTGIFFGHKLGGVPMPLQNQESSKPTSTQNTNTHYKTATTSYH